MKEGKDIESLEKQTGMKVLFNTCEQVFATEESNEHFNIVYDMKDEYHETESKLIYPMGRRTILGSVSGKISLIQLRKTNAISFIRSAMERLWSVSSK